MNYINVHQTNSHPAMKPDNIFICQCSESIRQRNRVKYDRFYCCCSIAASLRYAPTMTCAQKMFLYMRAVLFHWQNCSQAIASNKSIWNPYGNSLQHIMQTVVAIIHYNKFKNIATKQQYSRRTAALRSHIDTMYFVLLYGDINVIRLQQIYVIYQRMH